MERFFELLFKYLAGAADLITPVRYCDKGLNVVKKCFGKPYKVYQSGICFKVPLIEEFDKVNIKKQVHFLNAHSTIGGIDKIIPYNITVDAQVEFRIIDPYVIYQIDTFDTGGREPLRIYVDNEVHLLINDVVGDCNASNIQEKINKALDERNNKETNDYFKKAIFIERIVISAFDYNLSLRHSQ